MKARVLTLFALAVLVVAPALFAASANPVSPEASAQAAAQVPSADPSAAPDASGQVLSSDPSCEAPLAALAVDPANTPLPQIYYCSPGVPHCLEYFQCQDYCIGVGTPVCERNCCDCIPFLPN